MKAPLERLRAAMADLGIDALLVTDLSNVGWLTGFSGSAGRVVVAPADALFVTDGRYTIQAEQEVKNMPSASFGPPSDYDTFTAEQIKLLGVPKISFEAANLTYAGFEKLKGKLVDVDLLPGPDLFGPLKLVKSPEEIEKIRVACRFADLTFEYMLGRIQAGRTEMEVHLDLEFFIRRHGYGLAFPPIVISGERSARPHGHASGKVLEAGDFITMDFGANIEGYNSDLTRTVVLGEASPRHREVYNQVLKAELAAIDACRAGVAARAVDTVAREVLDEIDLAKYFVHGLGHGLGRVVHDSGRLAQSSEDVLEVGQVWTIEPGVYIEGFGGVRIEDDVVVTHDGVEILTHAPKELIELPLV